MLLSICYLKHRKEKTATQGVKRLSNSYKTRQFGIFMAICMFYVLPDCNVNYFIHFTIVPFDYHTQSRVLLIIMGKVCIPVGLPETILYGIKMLFLSATSKNYLVSFLIVLQCTKTLS